MSKSQYITGLRAVEQILATESTDIRRIYAEYQTANPRVEAVIKMARQNNIEIQPANRARLMQISGESRHQGVVAEVRRSTLLDEAGLRTMVEERLQEGRPILLLVLDGVQDPHNLGACMRTADAAGVDAVIVPRHGAAGLGPTVSKVAAGAAEQLPFVPVGNLGRVLGWLGDYGVRCVGTSDKADSTLFEAIRLSVCPCRAWFPVSTYPSPRAFAFTKSFVSAAAQTSDSPLEIGYLWLARGMILG
jgi:23S rRNA (guanosine2251-2'-O)-methyltransferase